MNGNKISDFAAAPGSPRASRKVCIVVLWKYKGYNWEYVDSITNGGSTTMKYKFILIICIILFISLGLTACENKANDRNVKGADYNKVMNQGLKQEGIPLQNVLSEETIDGNKIIMYTLNNAIGAASMAKNKDGWLWDRSSPLFDFKDLSGSLSYTVGGFVIRIPKGKAYYIAVGKIFNANIKKITIFNGELTSTIISKDKNTFWFKILDNLIDLNKNVKAYDEKGNIIKLEENQDFLENLIKTNANNNGISCFISNYDPKANTIAIDEVEWVLQDNIKRINELGLNSDNDFPNGFYIYNKKIDNITKKISKDAKLLIIMGSEQKPTDKAGFAKRIKEYKTPYVITIKSDTIVKIAEQYVP